MHFGFHLKRKLEYPPEIFLLTPTGLVLVSLLSEENMCYVLLQ